MCQALLTYPICPRGGLNDSVSTGKSPSVTSPPNGSLTEWIATNSGTPCSAIERAAGGYRMKAADGNRHDSMIAAQWAIVSTPRLVALAVRRQ